MSDKFVKINDVLLQDGLYWIVRRQHSGGSTGPNRRDFAVCCTDGTCQGHAVLMSFADGIHWIGGKEARLLTPEEAFEVHLRELKQ